MEEYLPKEVFKKYHPNIWLRGNAWADLRECASCNLPDLTKEWALPTPDPQYRRDGKETEYDYSDFPQHSPNTCADP